MVIPVEKSKNSREQFTIEIVEAKNNGEIRFSWDDVVAVAGFEVMK